MENGKDDYIYDAGNSSNAAVAPTVTINYPEIVDAYFAKKIVEKEFKKSTKVYTVKSGDFLGKIAKSHNTTVAKIKSDNSLKSDNIKKDQKLNIDTKKEKGQRISFKYTNTGNVGQDLFIIVKTENFRDKKIQIDIHQGKEKVIAEKDKLVEVLQEGEVKLIKTKVGEWAANQDIINKDDFKDWAIAKINLRPKTDESMRKWQAAINKTKDNKTYLYFLVDAHKHNPDYEPMKNLVYHGRNPDGDGKPDKTTVLNYWLDMEGRWFELFGKRVCPISPLYRSHFVIHCTAREMSENSIKGKTKFNVVGKKKRSGGHIYVNLDGSKLVIWPLAEKNVWATKIESQKGLKGQMFHIELNYGPPTKPSEKMYQTLANLL